MTYKLYIAFNVKKKFYVLLKMKQKIEYVVVPSERISGRNRHIHTHKEAFENGTKLKYLENDAEKSKLRV